MVVGDGVLLLGAGVVCVCVCGWGEMYGVTNRYYRNACICHTLSRKAVDTFRLRTIQVHLSYYFNGYDIFDRYVAQGNTSLLTVQGGNGLDINQCACTNLH